LRKKLRTDLAPWSLRKNDDKDSRFFVFTFVAFTHPQVDISVLHQNEEDLPFLIDPDFFKLRGKEFSERYAELIENARAFKRLPRKELSKAEIRLLAEWLLPTTKAEITRQLLRYENDHRSGSLSRIVLLFAGIFDYTYLVKKFHPYLKFSIEHLTKRPKEIASEVLFQTFIEIDQPDFSFDGLFKDILSFGKNKDLLPDLAKRFLASSKSESREPLASQYLALSKKLSTFLGLNPPPPPAEPVGLALGYNDLVVATLAGEKTILHNEHPLVTASGEVAFGPVIEAKLKQMAGTAAPCVVAIPFFYDKKMTASLDGVLQSLGIKNLHFIPASLALFLRFYPDGNKKSRTVLVCSWHGPHLSGEIIRIEQKRLHRVQAAQHRFDDAGFSAAHLESAIKIMLGLLDEAHLKLDDDLHLVFVVGRAELADKDFRAALRQHLKEPRAESDPVFDAAVSALSWPEKSKEWTLLNFDFDLR